MTGNGLQAVESARRNCLAGRAGASAALRVDAFRFARVVPKNYSSNSNPPEMAATLPSISDFLIRHGINIIPAAIAVYMCAPYALAHPVAAVIRRRYPATAMVVFEFLRRMGREKLLIPMACVLPLGTVWSIQETSAHPLDIVLRHLPDALPFMVLFWAGTTVSLLSWFDDGGFRIETTRRGRGSLHIHRRLDKIGLKAFEHWLPGALMRCHEMGMTTVEMNSPLLCNERRLDRLIARLEKLETSSFGIDLSLKVERIWRLPLIWPAAWRFWREFGRYRQEVRLGRWPLWRQILARFWWPQRGVRIILHSNHGQLH